MRVRFLAALALVSLIGCGAIGVAPTPTPRPAPTADAPLVVYADVALAPALAELQKAFYQTADATTLQLHFAEPAALRERLANTLRPELVITADPALLKDLRKQNRLDHVQVVARDPLAIIIARTNPGNIERLQDLTIHDYRMAIAAENTPLGKATRRLIDNLSHDLMYGPDFPGNFYKQVVAQPSNGGQVLEQVVFNQAHVGIVFASDIGVQHNRVTELEIPEGLDIATDYTAAVLKSTHDPARAAGFVGFLKSADADAIWRAYALEAGE